MARRLARSTWRTFAYSMTASRYCSRAKYLSPRSRCRAFWASGDREHPVMATRSARKTMIQPRDALDILISSVSLCPDCIGSTLDCSLRRFQQRQDKCEDRQGEKEK